MPISYAASITRVSGQATIGPTPTGVGDVAAATVGLLGGLTACDDAERTDLIVALDRIEAATAAVRGTPRSPCSLSPRRPTRAPVGCLLVASVKVSPNRSRWHGRCPRPPVPARSDRRVSMRAAPDTMACVTGFVACEQGIAAWVSLDRDARAKKNTGDERSIAQIMADRFVERLTGQAPASAVPVPVEIGITMTADSLLAGDQGPATVAGYGPIPADLARHIAGTDEEQPGRVFVRRIFTDPIDDTVLTVDSRPRRFDGALKRVVGYRDQTCRVPYCTDPIRHIDHIERHTDGGPRTVANGQGLFERDNYVKELPARKP